MNVIRPKSIQIDYDLFLSIVAYISEHADPQDPKLKNISAGIHEKLDAIERRTLFTAYKMAPSAEERETARQRYLELMGIPKSFRWPASQDVNVMHSDL